MSTPRSIAQFHQALDCWYQKCGRNDLPWRHTDDAYEILVSEMMLQQTQVSTVLDRFYGPFLTAFPSLTALAQATPEAVRKQWQGLGYYRRAGFLHETAKQSAPKLPADLDGLLALPGIGRNTAHAVLAFAHHRPYPVMEANVKRVLARIYALEEPSDKQLWALAFKLLNEAEPFDYNQAMMDLGAMVCTPKAPACDICPAATLCIGKRNPEAYPKKKAKKPVPVRRQQVLVVQDTQKHVYSTPREGAFLQGLHQFIELGAEEKAIELNGQIYPQEDWEHIGTVEQVYSHFKQQAEIYLLHYVSTHERRNWYDVKQLEQLPLSKKEQKIIALLTR